MTDLKKTLQEALQKNDLDSIADLARTNKAVLSQLIRISYDKETLSGRRAIKAVGQAARALVGTDYNILRETVRKLLWTLNDESGGIGWSAPEVLGEIVAADPVRFRDIVPIIAEVFDIEETVFRAGVLYALSRVALVAPSLVREQAGLIGRALADGDPMVRFYGLELAKNLWAELSGQEKEAINIQLRRMSSDRAEIWVYEHNDFINVQIGEAVKALIKLIGGI